MPVEVPWQAWYGDTKIELDLPAQWQVDVASMVDAPRTNSEAVLQALRRPIGTPPLHKLARESRRAVIVVEDMTRPAPTASLLHSILSELKTGGLHSQDVSIVIGLGAHAPMRRQELLKKGWDGR